MTMTPIAHSITTYADAELARADGTEADYIADAILGESMPLGDRQRFIEETIQLWRNQRTTIASQQAWRNEQLESEIAGMKSVIEGHEADLARLRTANETQMERILKVQQQHREDIARISERLTQEAEDRGWCSEYDRIVDDLNRGLHVELETRGKTGTVEITYTVTVRANASDVSVDSGADLAEVVYNILDESRIFRAGNYETDENGRVEFEVIRYSYEDREQL